MIRTMDMQRAIKSIGKRARKHDISNMYHALSLCSWDNTEEEEERRIAALYVLRFWAEYTQACRS